MRLRHWLCYFLLGIVCCSVLSAQPENSAKDEEPETELAQWMDRMNSAFRKLRRQADNASLNASSIELVATMQDAARKALELIPAKTEDLPEADRAKFVERYRDDLGKMITQLQELQAAFETDDNAEALQLIRAIGSARKQGHEEYKKDSN
jgi:soluble cytochrome b562